jgi:hypothetical protein
MSEGTKVFNAQAEIEELKRRIEVITLTMASPRAPMGCVCPAGAEIGCGSMMCPRRAPRGMTF